MIKPTYVCVEQVSNKAGRHTNKALITVAPEYIYVVLEEITLYLSIF